MSIGVLVPVLGFLYLVVTWLDLMGRVAYERLLRMLGRKKKVMNNGVDSRLEVSTTYCEKVAV
jgi:hypothetical protein